MEACDEEGWRPSSDEPSCAEEAVRPNEGALGSTQEADEKQVVCTIAFLQ